MTKVYCDDNECQYNSDGVCSRKKIGVSFLNYKNEDGKIYHSEVDVRCKLKCYTCKYFLRSKFGDDDGDTGITGYCNKKEYHVFTDGDVCNKYKE